MLNTSASSSSTNQTGATRAAGDGKSQRANSVAAGFADDRHADLARVGEFLFHLLGDVAGDHLRLDVVDLVRLDHDPDLAARLHGEDLLDALLVRGDLLEALQPLDVHFQRLAARAGAAAAHRVGRLGEHGLDGADLDLVVVRLDRVHHVVGLAVLAGDLRADQRVAALDLVGERLADVVQHRAPLEQQRVHPQLAGHDAGDVRALDQVRQDVLAVGGAVAEPAEQGDQLGVHVGDAELGHGVLAGPLAEQLDLGLAAVVGLLDPLRVDPAVLDEALQGEAGDLAAHRVETGEQHRLRRVVDDQVDAGYRLEGADVPALAADDPALHLVAGQVHHGDHGLAGLLHCHPLDGEGDDLAGALVRLGLRLVLDVPHRDRGLALGLVLHGRDELVPGVVRGQPRDPLELLPGRRGRVVEGRGPLVERLPALLHAADLGVEALFPLADPQLAALQVAAELAHLVLDGPDLVLDLAAVPRGLLGPLGGTLDDSLGLGLSPGPQLLGVGLRAVPELVRVGLRAVPELLGVGLGAIAELAGVPFHGPGRDAKPAGFREPRGVRGR